MAMSRQGAAAIERLEDLGFVVLEENEEDADFGNSVTLLAGYGLRVRLVRDRSQEFLDVGPIGTDGWYDLELALEAVGVQVGDKNLGGFDQRVTLVASHQEALRQAFSVEELESTCRKIEELREERVGALFPGLVRLPDG